MNNDESKKPAEDTEPEETREYASPACYLSEFDEETDTSIRTQVR